jgi:DNA modification methylase
MPRQFAIGCLASGAGANTVKRRRVWRDSSETSHEAKLSNAKACFSCASCGRMTSAPASTRRAALALCKGCFGKRPDLRENALNDLSGSEWAALSKSVEQYNGTRTPKQRLHGAAFPASLVEAQIKIYSKQGDLILDPFLGVGTTCEVAERLGRRSIGVELNPAFARLAEQDILDRARHQVICDDVRRLRSYVEDESVDFVITSPPYANLLKAVRGGFAYKWREHSSLNVVPNPQPYSEHSADLGNLSYAEFMDALSAVLVDTFSVLKRECYAVWVVKDYRDLKSGTPLVNFHSDVIRAAERAGFVLWDIRIYDQTKYRPLVVLGYPSRNYYLNIGHSYILVLKKTSH